MTNRGSNRSRCVGSAMLVVLIGGLLAACGSSSKGSADTAAVHPPPSANKPQSGSGARRLSRGEIQRFQAFASCMRRNGVNLPAPNVSGRGAIFNTTGIDNASANYGAAAKKCAFGIPGGTHAPSIRLGKTDKIHVEKIDPTKIHIGKIDPGKIHIEKITPDAASPGIGAPPASSPPK